MSVRTDLALALRMLRRESRSGALRLLFAALVIAVASFTSVGFFADRVRQALESEATQLLGADLLLIADHAWGDGVVSRAQGRGLRIAHSLSFPSMVTGPGGAQLADIKAVSEAYPLRGRLRIAPGLNMADAPAQGVPPAGSVWIDERLASAISVAPGAVLRVGNRSLTIGAILTLEPDRGVNFFGVAPRLLMNRDDVAATGLIQTGSRATYQLMLAGDPAAVDAFRREIAPELGRGERLEDTQGARPEIRSALDRAQRFLGLAALLAVVLAAAGVALAARRYVQQHLDPFAMMRCLGATQGRLLFLSLVQFVVLGVLASAVGVAIGYAAHYVLNRWLAELLATPLPGASWLPGLQGLGVGLTLAVAFALPPLLQLRRVPTLRVIRRELGPTGAGTLVAWLVGGLALAGLMLWVAQDPKLGAWVVGGFGVALLAFFALARGAVAVVARLGSGGGVGWRRGVVGLGKRPLAATVQVVSLALGFMALILLTVTRGELLAAWQNAVPPGAPNRFVINVQPEQVAEVEAFFARELGPTSLHPMIRGRLVAIGGRPVSSAAYADDRAKRLVDREFNLSWSDRLPETNRQVAGRWFAASDRGQGLVSVEEGIARTLGIAVGDELTWSIAGETQKSTVVGLRKLSWDSMRVNFFVLFPSGVLEPFPKSYVASFHLREGQQGVVNRLVAAFPNLTVVDVAAIIRQLHEVIDQVARAVQFIFLFTLAAGLLVLHAAMLAAFDERRYELALMRALGARQRQLRAALIAEFATVGGLAGAVAALGALAVGAILASRVFELEMVPNPWVLPAAAVIGAIVTAAAGAWATTRLLRTPAIEALRA